MLIYRAISPSGKCYIGITSTSLKRRWQSHVHRANTQHRPHPLCSAIRKYGSTAFVIETLVDGLSEADAKAGEILYIRIFNSTDRRYGYNLSKGGDYDGKTGSIAAWAKINATPESRAAYRKLLSEQKLANDWVDYKKLHEALAEWRRANPKEAAKNDARAIAACHEWGRNNPEAAYDYAIRALFIARQKIAEDPVGFRIKLSEGIRASFADPARLERHREMVRGVWAKRSDEELINITDAISQGRIAYYKSLSPNDKRAHDVQLAEARTHINHDFRKRRQKAALIAYWTPERRTEMGAQRRAKRMAELGIQTEIEYAGYRKMMNQLKARRRNRHDRESAR